MPGIVGHIAQTAGEAIGEAGTTGIEGTGTPLGHAPAIAGTASMLEPGAMLDNGIGLAIGTMLVAGIALPPGAMLGAAIDGHAGPPDIGDPMGDGLWPMTTPPTPSDRLNPMSAATVNADLRRDISSPPGYGRGRSSAGGRVHPLLGGHPFAPRCRRDVWHTHDKVW